MEGREPLEGSHIPLSQKALQLAPTFSSSVCVLRERTNLDEYWTEGKGGTEGERGEGGGTHAEGDALIMSVDGAEDLQGVGHPARNVDGPGAEPSQTSSSLGGVNILFFFRGGVRDLFEWPRISWVRRHGGSTVKPCHRT